MAFTIELSSDVHPQPGPTSLKSSAIPVITTRGSEHHNHQSPSGSLPLYSRTGNLSFNDHTDYLTSSLCQVNRVRHLLTKEALLITLNALVFSKLFYCSTVWSGTSQQNIGKLQILQNFAARILAGKRKYDHISPSLKELKWLPIKEMLRLRDVTMVFNACSQVPGIQHWSSALPSIVTTPGERTT